MALRQRGREGFGALPDSERSGSGRDAGSRKANPAVTGRITEALFWREGCRWGLARSKRGAGSAALTVTSPRAVVCMAGKL